MDLHVFPIPIPPPTSLSTRSLWVFLVHQPRALVSCIQPGLVICFTLGNIHVSMLFSQNILPSPSPTELDEGFKGIYLKKKKKKNHLIKISFHDLKKKLTLILIILEMRLSRQSNISIPRQRLLRSSLPSLGP